MITVAEIKAWLEDERDSALSQLRDEPNHNNNHLATAYSAEYEFAIRALQFIEEGETTRNIVEPKKCGADGHWGEPTCECGALTVTPDGNLVLNGRKLPGNRTLYEPASQTQDDSKETK